MKILISGASGFIGSALMSALDADGHELARLVRTPRKGAAGEVYWDPLGAQDVIQNLEGFDAVVHLAGESIGAGRWTAAKKQRILESRKKGTTLLAQSLAAAAVPPKVLVSASAIGYYGDRGDEILREDSRPGSGFLPDVCRAWEEAARPAQERGIRVACVRIGVVLHARGGALPRMLLPFRLGVGGRIGSGRQYMSWICLDDLVAIIQYLLAADLSGPVNAVSPNPVTNREFARMLGGVLARPSILPFPGFVLRVLLGEMADALLLSSARVEPAKLAAAGYRFKHPDLEAALRHVVQEGKSA
jgi:uncharacterized protein (TIGR01777 family)